MSEKRTDSIRILLATRGSMTAAEIARELNASQPTISRALSSMPDIVRIGQTRNTRYALSRPIANNDSNWPLYQIDQLGQAQITGTLFSLHQGEFYFEPKWKYTAYHYLLNGEEHPQLFPDLPWFLDDMRPQGYLGRLLAHRHGKSLQIGTNPENWTIDESLTAILAYGEDTPGNFVLGKNAIDTFLATKASSSFIKQENVRDTYNQAARQVSAGDELPNSSAGGEQPKFSACIRSLDDECRHVIVKFSGSLQTDSGRRWAELLRAESIASEELASIGLPTSNTRFLTTDERAFLEVERFDRPGQNGRSGTLMLRTVLAGLGEELDQTWTNAAQVLMNNSWLTKKDVDHIATFEHFGRLIGNSDMHLGNLSLHLAPELPLKLCPIYDMLPMRYAPLRSGDLPTIPIKVRAPRPEEIKTWLPAAQAAAQFWERFITDASPSSDLLECAQVNLDTVKLALKNQM